MFLAPQWQIALATLVGFLIGVLCTYVACCITDRTDPPGSQVQDTKEGGVGKGDESPFPDD